MAPINILAIFLFIAASYTSSSSAQDEECTGKVAKVPKTIKWEPYYLSGGPVRPARPVQDPIALNTRDYIGSGYVYTPRDAEYTGFAGIVLLANENNWHIVNCTYSFTSSPPPLQKRGCTSGDLALYLPKPVNGDVGTIGTTMGLKYPERSLWAVYDLHVFRVTPDADGPEVEGKELLVRVEAWNDQGKKAGKHVERIIGGKAGYNITIPDGGWTRVVKWQVNVLSDDQKTRYGFYLDDIQVTELEYEPACPRPAPDFGPTPPVQTFSFNGLTLGKPIPSPYHGFNFEGWTVTTWPSSSLSSDHNGTPALYGHGTEDYVPSFNTADNSYFDLINFDLSINASSIPPTVTPSELELRVGGFPGCDGHIPQVTSRSLTSFTERINLLEAEGPASNQPVFERMLRASVTVRYYLDAGQYGHVGFWIRNVEYRHWRRKTGADAGRGPFLSGCLRCRKYLSSMCEAVKMRES